MTSTVAPPSAARLRRLDLRVVLGLALLLAGVVGTVGVVQRAGQVIDAQDVRVAELGLAPGVAVLGVQDRGLADRHQHVRGGRVAELGVLPEVPAGAQRIGDAGQQA